MKQRTGLQSNLSSAPVLALFRVLVLFFLAICGHALGQQQSNKAGTNDLAVAEKTACIRNLEQIYSAIEAYQAEHKDLPDWISDLVPKYISDPAILVCPVCRRTGKTEAGALADPKLPSSYLFEFCPLPLGREAPMAPTRTRRDWKRRQMGLVGSAVPILRCRFHNPVLNVGFDGKIYESPSRWEDLFAKKVPQAQLSAASLFSDGSAAEGGQKKLSLPNRDPQARPQLLDLSTFYNAGLSESWHGGTSNDLSSLPTGIQTLGGIEFDVRGLVQLAGRTATNFPAEVKQIPVKLKCKHLHFLHSAIFGTRADEGKQIGSYIIHFTTNRMQLEIPIQYGQTLRNWHKFADEPPSQDLKVVWVGQNAVSRKEGRSLQLFLTSWTNLLPDLEIESIDCVSTRNALAAPFLIAITAD